MSDAAFEQLQARVCFKTVDEQLFDEIQGRCLEVHHAGTQLRCANRAMDSAAKPYVAALGFAMTRPFVSGLSFTRRQWRHLWEPCASVAESQGLDASTWGYAIEVVSRDWPINCGLDLTRWTRSVPQR
jgi:hypothetical protein